ncbi:hypothetical protein [Veillonella agrestimuris]|uniref:hypothetical protein n=1 Tax=Veillonella agrestimuris TaxID=2941340 RepID=UPI00203C7CCB|nr:hypothetical protein [Veillonella agrestimuris]
MNTLLDICKRSIFMNIFIVMIPLISYMIHNGSSATVALVWYFLLSLVIPWAYLSFKTSVFGTQSYRINRWLFVLAWGLVHVVTYQFIFLGLDLSGIWELPTFGRDVVFLVGMYSQVTLMLIVAFLGTRLIGGGHE